MRNKKMSSFLLLLFKRDYFSYEERKYGKTMFCFKPNNPFSLNQVVNYLSQTMKLLEKPGNRVYLVEN